MFINSTAVEEPVTAARRWGTQNLIRKIEKSHFGLYGVRIGVFHDSELNKSIWFAL